MFEVFFDDVLNSWVMAKSICRMCGSYTEFDPFESEEEALNAASEKTKLGERVD
ncbi:hypothetical protein GUJ76_24315, partial|nr:hypothetical protein [Escherichia coli]